MQECPLADLAICAVISEALSALTRQRWTTTAQQQAFPTEPLAEMLRATTRDADQTVIAHPDFLAHFGLASPRLTAAEVWHDLLETLIDKEGPWWKPLQTIMQHGPLSRRITNALHADNDNAHDLFHVYQRLCECLATGHMF